MGSIWGEQEYILHEVSNNENQSESSILTEAACSLCHSGHIIMCTLYAVGWLENSDVCSLGSLGRVPTFADYIVLYGPKLRQHHVITIDLVRVAGN